MANRFLFQPAAEFPLEGYVNRKAVGRVVRRIRHRLRREPGRRFVLECAQVVDFSGYALAALAELRRELQWQGSDLALDRCSEYVKARLAVPLFESLVGPFRTTSPIHG